MADPSSQFIPILLNLVAALFGAVGQYLYKWGGQRIGQIELWKNWQLFLGMALFCGVMVMFVLGFKAGGRLSVTYPVYATTFIWGFLLAVLVDREPWSPMQLTGIAVILAGVVLVAVGGAKA